MKIVLPKQMARVFATAVVLAAALVVFAVVNYNVSQNLMVDSLKNEGVSIAFSLEAAARAAGVDDPRELSPVMEKFRNQKHIAYMTVLNRNNIVVAELDGEKTGRQISDQFIDRVNETQQVTITKKSSKDTGVYEIIVPVHLGQLDRKNRENSGEITEATQGMQSREGKYYILLLGVYQAHGQEMVRPALIQLVLVVIMVSVIGVLGAFQFRTLKRYLELENLNKQNEKLAAIGTVSAGVAHEIKNPLGAIKGFSQLLAEGKSGPEEESEYIRLILKEARRLESFLDQLLDFTRNRKYKFAPTDITALTSETAQLVTDQARDSQIEIKIDFKQPALLVAADTEALQQVLLNLFINSIQAMPSGGTLFVSSFTASGRQVIEVRDTGPGLAPGTEEDIFQPFYTSKNKGIGLGLALSKQIIEDHGGAIKAGNAEDGGAVFTITLPGK